MDQNGVLQLVTAQSFSAGAMGIRLTISRLCFLAWKPTCGSQTLSDPRGQHLWNT